MTLVLHAAAVSDPGLVRANNEDCAHVGARLLAVADGIGGLPAGEVASEIMIKALVAAEDALDGREVLPVLRAAVDTAGRQIREAVAAHPAHDGMGTTVTALVQAGDELAVVHVGDSRAYRYRDGELRQLTHDDTFVQALVDRGVITAEEARRHPQRSLVTRAVQGDPVTPACAVLPSRPGDRYLLCSDGLSDFVSDAAIAEALERYPEPQRCAERLVSLALDAGGPDNVTVVVANAVPVDVPQAAGDVRG